MVNRVVTVLVDSTAIGDGEIAPPHVGQIVTYAVTFDESDRIPDAHTVRGVIEPSTEPPRSGGGGTGGEQPVWSGVFRGDGWAADWTGPRPRLGPVDLRGHFFASFGALHENEIRGRVTRVRIVGERWTYDREVPTAREWQTMRDVEAAPQWLTDERSGGSEGRVEYLVESVLVDLDLDDVPELQPRPAFLPLKVSAMGDDLWMLDQQLPRVVRRCGESLFVHDYPAPIVDDWMEGDRLRAVHAAESGCWASGRSGLCWIGVDGSTARLSDRPISTCAVHGDTILACASGEWLLFRRDVLRSSAEVPAGTPLHAVWADGAFVVVVRVGGGSGGGRVDDDVRLVRVAVDGMVTVGELLPTEPRIRGAVLLKNPLAVMFRTSPVTDVVAVDEGLRPGATSVLRQTIFDGGMLGDHVWTVGHPQPGYDRGEGQRWMLTLHDRRTLNPVSTALLSTPSPSVAMGGSGVVWIADGCRLAELVPGFTQVPEFVPLEVLEPD